MIVRNLKSFFFLLSRVRHSSDGRVLITNFCSLSALQIIGYVFPLITLPYISRVVGIEHFGEIAFATAVIAYFQAVVDWGFNFTATRDVARIKSDKAEVSRIYSEVFWARVFLCAISLAVLCILILLIPRFREISCLLCCRFLIVIGYVLYGDWLFQAIEKMKYITILNIVANTLFTISVFIFITEKEDYIYQPLLSSLGFVISGLIAFFVLVPAEGVRLKFVTSKNVFIALKTSSAVFINQAMPVISENLTVILLGFWGGAVANGKFDAGYKVIGVLERFILMLSRTFFPFLARRIDKHLFFFRLNLISAVFVTILAFVFAPFIIRILFSKEFYNAVLALRIISIAVVFSMLINVYGINYLLLQGYEKRLRNMTVMASVAGIVFAVPLLYYFSWVGAALTLVLTRAILGICVTVEAVRIQRKTA